MFIQSEQPLLATDSGTDQPPLLSADSSPSSLPNTALATAGSVEQVLFAIIGDYGLDTKDTYAVSELVKSWNPEFIATVGDNNYPDGSMGPFDDNVGQFYQEFIHNYKGSYGPGATEQRFYTSLGNHDWASIYCSGTTCNGPYFEYFSIDPKDRYYTFAKGPVRFFMMDSDSKEPDGISGLSKQALWLKEQLAISDATWNLVLMHHPPYSSGGHRNHEQVQWPFALWGADAVVSGHNHLYERIERDDMLFFVNGLGGKSRHYFRDVQPDWVKYRYNAMDGAMRVEASNETITFQFYDRFHTLHDSYTLHKEPEEDDGSLHSASTQYNLSVPLSHAANDAIQDLTTGAVQPIDYVLNLGEVRDDEPTMVGLRFSGVNVPHNAIITSAHVEFTNQRDENSDMSLTISGEKGCNVRPFTAEAYSLTNRPKTNTTIQWGEGDDWELVGESHKTVDIAPILQEVIDHVGWQSGNALALFLHGSGQRHSVAYELQPAMAPVLHLTYELPSREANNSTHSENNASEEINSDSTVSPWSNGLYLPMLINHTCSGK